MLLLLRATTAPPLGAAAMRDTVQASLPAPLIDELAQDSELGVVIPIPLRLTFAVGLDEEVLLIVSCPLAAPLTVGSNCTERVAD